MNVSKKIFAEFFKHHPEVVFEGRDIYSEAVVAASEVEEEAAKRGLRIEDHFSRGRSGEFDFCFYLEAEIVSGGLKVSLEGASSYGAGVPAPETPEAEELLCALKERKGFVLPLPEPAVVLPAVDWVEFVAGGWSPEGGTAQLHSDAMIMLASEAEEALAEYCRRCREIIERARTQ